MRTYKICIKMMVCTLYMYTVYNNTEYLYNKLYKMISIEYISMDCKDEKYLIN